MKVGDTVFLKNCEMQMVVIELGTENARCVWYDVNDHIADWVFPIAALEHGAGHDDQR